MAPKVPAWFARHLRSMNPTLGARHAGPQGWEIVQFLPRVVDLGSWNGMHLREVKRVPQRIMVIPEIGSRAFAQLNSLWAPRFDKRFDEFAKVNRVRTA